MRVTHNLISDSHKFFAPNWLHSSILSIFCLTLVACQAPNSRGNDSAQLSIPGVWNSPSAGQEPNQYQTVPEVDIQTPIASLFEQARILVENETGTPLSYVTLKLSDDKDITDEVSHETRRLVHSQFDNTVFATHFLGAVMSGQAGTYAALYASRHKQVMISQVLLEGYRDSLPPEPAVQDSALLALLIHELVHASDDQQYQIHEKRELNFRASFAQSAAFEGHAQWVTRQICKKSGCEQGLKALDDFMFSRQNSPNQLTQTVQAISRNVLEYSYIEGERFVAALAQRPDGLNLIAQLLSKPPVDPIQMLDPDSYPNLAREQRNQQLLGASNSIEHVWLTQPWVSVETSPLKGVNLRADPTRRRAAIDGFTRLITAMVAQQLYDQSSPARAPIDVTILQTDRSDTARLFAETLHQNSQVSGVITTRAYVSEGTQAPEILDQPDHVPVNAIALFSTVEPLSADINYYTVVANFGPHVVQISGQNGSDTPFTQYAVAVLSALNITTY